MNFEIFLQFHQAQLESTRVPQVFWRTIYEKVTSEIFNTGDYFSIEKILYEDDDEVDEQEDNRLPLNGVSPDDVDVWASSSRLYEQCEYRVVVAVDRMEPTDPANIFLIDHMCTFEELSKRKELIAQSDQLLERLCSLVNLKESQCLAKEQKMQLVEHHLFKYLQSYCINQPQHHNQTATRTFWYILDEFGARIGHNLTEPTFRCVPFTYLQGGISYNLLFPIKPVVVGELVTYNYIESNSLNLSDSSLTASLLLPWEDADLTDVDYRQRVECPAAFAFKHKLEEIMPTDEGQSRTSDLIRLPTKEAPLKVYSQYKYVNENLTDGRFKLVDNREEATVLWLLEPFYGYKDLPPTVLVNQFPFETVLTVKDLFAIVCRRAAKSNAELDQADHLLTEDTFSPFWLMPTFDLQNELPKFVSYYQHRQRAHLDNHWIVKPWNLSRSLETVITARLPEIVKLRNALPKVVCKYIDRPVLFRRDDLSTSPNVKFDLRFIVLLKSVQPLQLYVYRNFWIRFANRSFSMDELECYEKHFTVMNYAVSSEDEEDEGESAVQLRQMFCSEFISLFDAQYGKGSWARLEADTYAAIKEAFECATMKAPPAGIGHCTHSRAMYGIDVLPRWRKLQKTGDQEENEMMQPTLLEVNWMPDCKRATEYYPDFFNEVFATLFTDEPVSENMVRL